MKSCFFDETEFNAKFTCAGDTLSAEEEIALSKRILAGNAAKETLAGASMLTDDERADLQRTVEDGKEACGRLVLANRPRAMKFAVSTFRRNPFGLDDLDDYCQTAMKVICEAAQTFDWRYHCRFSTWVHRRLVQEMIRENALMAYPLRIPEENLSRISPLRRAAETLGIGEAAKTLGIPRESAEKLLMAGTSGKSFQESVSADDPDMELGDVIADTSAMTAEEIEEEIDRETNWNKLREAFPALSAEDKQILLGRNGFISGEPLPMRTFVGGSIKSLSSVQKREIAAVKHLKTLVGLPLAG